MNLLKMILILACITFISSNYSNAQTNLSEAEKKEVAKNMEKYLAKLDLTDAQKKPYQEITKRYKGKLTKVKNSNDGKLKKYKQMQEILENKNTEMRGLLTKNQYELYLEQQEKKKEFMKEHKN